MYNFRMSELTNEFASKQPENDNNALSNTMALVIDVQDFSHMDTEDAKNYTRKLAESLMALREQGIPITWVTMRPGAQLYEPEKVDHGVLPQVRDMEELRKMGYHGVDPKLENHEVFRDFLLTHGPRLDEAVSVKSLKSALVEKEDVLGKDKYQKALELECGEPLSKYFDSNTTLAGYMRDKGIQNVIMMGAVSSHCIAETAVSAAVKGFNSQVVVDAVLSWQGEEGQVDPNTSLLLWRGADNDEVAFNAYHHEKISTKVMEIVSDQVRGFSAADRAQIEGIQLGVLDSFITQYSTANVTPQPQPSSPHQ